MTTNKPKNGSTDKLATGSNSNTNEGQILSHTDSRPTPGRRQRRMTEISEVGPGLLEMVAGDDPDEHEPGEHDLEAPSSSIIKFYPDWCRCFECLKRSEPLEADASIIEQLRHFFACPPKGTYGRIILITLICFFLWGFFFYLFIPLSSNGFRHDPMDNPAFVHGALFALAIIEITGLLGGIVLKKFFNLPPLLGPLVLGILYHNVPVLNVFHWMKSISYRDCYGIETCEHLAKHTINAWVKPIRIIALGLILTRAGLELSPKQLRKLKGIVPLLAFGPCIVEAIVCAATSYLFFNIFESDEDSKMSVPMCFVGGFALAAVSPAVVVPGALSLKKSGYGVMKGVPTLLIAASSIDDVLAISIYTIALGFAVVLPDQDNWKNYSGGVLGLLVGIIHGAVFGMILHFIPPRQNRFKAENRLILLLLINLTSVFAYEETFYNGAGSISILVTSFIAGFGWRSQPHWKRPMKKIEKALAHMWVLWVPLIFGTIGKEINFSSDSFGGVVLGKTFGVIFISLVFRCVAAFFLVWCAGLFNFKERLFIALSWIPKATVQAALAPLVLTRAAESNDAQAEKTATLVVNVAILAVLITAPLGSVLMALTGPKLLQQNTSPEITMQVEEEFPNGGGIDPSEEASTFDMLDRSRRGGGERLFRGSSNATIESKSDTSLKKTRSIHDHAKRDS